MRILVLDANQRSALAVTRSLGKVATVLTADDSTKALAGCSRYSSGYTQYPSPAKTPREFLSWLSAFIKAQDIDWVFPITEITSQLILAEPQTLGRAKIPFAPLATVMSLADKWNLVQLASSIGVPHPISTYYPNAEAWLSTDITSQRYPVVIKPCQSRRWLGDCWLETSVHIARSEKQLRQLLTEKDYLHNYPFMLQQYIDGRGAGIFALYNKGKPVTFFSHQRLREKPPEGGVSVLSRSVALEPIMLGHARALLDAVQWHGVAMVEFRIATDGTPYLMEVNTRFWGSLQLAIDAGVDFPALLYRLSIGETVEPITSYRTGQQLRWLLGDIDSLYLMLRGKNVSKAQKLRRLFDFFTPHLFNTRHETNRWDDCGPAWQELREYLHTLTT